VKPMTHIAGLAALALLSAWPAPVPAQAAVAPDGYWPTHAWRTSSPEAQGMDSRVLARALDFARDSAVPIHSLLIVRNGRIVLDAYFHPFQAGQAHDLASATKSIITTLVGEAIGGGKLSGVRQPVLPLLSDVPLDARDPIKERLTIEHLLSMTSGFACEYLHGETTLDDMRHSDNWVRYMVNRPMANEPGSTWAYCSPGMHLLSGILSRVTGVSALEFARRNLFAPLGIDSAFWPADPQGVSYGWGDLHLTPHDMAKVGYLWLRHGRWDGRQLVPADWMEAATRAQTVHMGEGYGYGFWVYPDRSPIVYEALGRGGQRISIVPEKNLVVVMTGGGFEPGDIGNFIGASLVSDGPIAENPEAAAALHAGVTAAACPRGGHAVPPAPEMAARVSGRRYAFDDNAIGLTSLTLTFPRPTEAVARLTFSDGRVESRPVGLDGQPRVSPGGKFGLPVALSGAWQGAGTFVLLYDEVANINAWRLELTFSGTEVTGSLSERTGLVDATLRGREAPGG
jgi:CubicO group peptidase (beta-lactamase class C family)